MANRDRLRVINDVAPPFPWKVRKFTVDFARGYVRFQPAMINATPQELRRAADIQEKIQSLQKKLNQILGAGVEPASPAPRKRKMSAAGIARIRAAAKARWAKVRAANRGAKPAKKARRKISAAARARLSALAKARWAQVKKAGKTSL